MAVSALIAALSVVLLFLSTVFPTGSLGFVALAGALTAIVVIECGYGWAAGTFLVSAVLAGLLLGLTAPLPYILLLGWYPIVKSLTERHMKSGKAVWLCKIGLAAVMGAVWLSVIRGVISVPFGLEMTWYIWLAAVAAICVIFALYDVVLGKVIFEYLNRIHRKTERK